jgi:two-component system chemotaxis response regulator CheB
VVGASAGGVEALVALVRSLSPDLDAAVLVVLHVSPTGTSLLPSILDRAADLPVKGAAHGDRLAPGHVYVAPPDHHLLINDGRVALTQTPRENGHRPAIDATMRTAAQAFDGASVGIVLSGARDDGTAGLLAIKDAGGIAIVQDPEEALYPSMPRSAIDHVEVDAVLPVTRIGDWLNALPSTLESERRRTAMATNSPAQQHEEPAA